MVQELLPAFPSFMLIDRFVDLESGQTSRAFKETAEKVGKAMAQTSELCRDSEETKETEQTTVTTAS